MSEIVWDEAALAEAFRSAKFRESLVPFAQQVMVIARRLAPVDTGYLRANIHVETSYQDALYVVSEAEYSAFQEFGTFKMPAHPFMRPALTEAQAKFA